MLLKVLKHKFSFFFFYGLSQPSWGFFLLVFHVILNREKFKLEIISIHFTVHFYIVQYPF